MKQGRSLRQAKAEQAAKKRQAKKRKRILVLVIELLVLFSLLGIGYIITREDVPQEQQREAVEENITESVSQEGYTTVAIFGGEATVNGQQSGINLDTMLVVSIDEENKEIRLVSIYRDLLTKQSNDQIKKAYTAYFEEGPMGAMRMLNQNFDLGIQEYIVLDHQIMADIVDCFGGVYVSVTATEADEMNRQIREEGSVVSGGNQILNGTQAVRYAQISKSSLGGDYKRTEREKAVIQELISEMKQSESTVISGMIEQVYPQLITSLEMEEFQELVSEAAQYDLIDAKGFAFDYMEGTIEGIGSVVIAVDFEGNVKELHRFLYPKNEYVVSGMVREIDAEMDSYYSQESSSEETGE